MFLLECPEDNSLSIVEDESVIFKNSVKRGNKVQFYYGSNQRRTWTGVVVVRSDSRTFLEKLLSDMETKRKELKKATRQESQESDTNVSGDETSKDKRKVKKRELFSPSRDSARHGKPKPPKKPKRKGKDSGPKKSNAAKISSLKKLMESLDKSSDSDSASDSSVISETVKAKIHKAKERQFLLSSKVEAGSSTSMAKAPAASPSKEELKRMLAEALGKNATLSQAKRNPSTLFVDHSNPEVIEDNSTKDFELSEQVARSSKLAINRDRKLDTDTGSSPFTTEDKLHISKESESKEAESLPDDFLCEGKTLPRISEVTSPVSKPPNSPDSGTPARKLSKPSIEVPEVDDAIDLDLTDTGRQLHQLYGKDYCENGEKMVLLTDDIYCRKSQLSLALGSSKLPTHFLRKIFLGVFIAEQLANVTLTGKAPKAAGKVEDPSKIEPLDPVAVVAITKYTKAIAKKMRWPSVDSIAELMPTLTQRVGEVKREMKKIAAMKQT